MFSKLFLQIPNDPEEHRSFSSIHATNAALSTGLLVDTNPDTYTAPPAPLPYDVDLGQPRALPGIPENNGNKIDPVPSADSQSVGEATGDTGLKSAVTYDDLKLDGKNQTDDLKGSPKVAEVEPSKLSECFSPATNEEDVCPTCFEGRIISNCSENNSFLDQLNVLIA